MQFKKEYKNLGIINYNVCRSVLRIAEGKLINVEVYPSDRHTSQILKSLGITHLLSNKLFSSISQYKMRDQNEIIKAGICLGDTTIKDQAGDCFIVDEIVFNTTINQDDLKKFLVAFDDYIEQIVTHISSAEPYTDEEITDIVKSTLFGEEGKEV